MQPSMARRLVIWGAECNRRLTSSGRGEGFLDSHGTDRLIRLAAVYGTLLETCDSEQQWDTYLEVLSRFAAEVSFRVFAEKEAEIARDILVRALAEFRFRLVVGLAEDEVRRELLEAVRFGS